MTGRTAAERWRIARHAARSRARDARRLAAGPLRAFALLRARAPQRLVIAPQDIRTSDPTVADDIYAGYFAFGSRIVDARGSSPFAIVPPNADWEAGLLGFGWLRHLRASQTELARENARALVREFLALHARPRRSGAWRADVAARRTMSWVSQSPLLLEGADADFYRLFIRSLGRHVAFLKAELAGGLRGEERLFAAIALAQATLCSDGYTNLRKRANRWLDEELKRQILPDGGHIGRNPRTLIELLLDLLPLRQAYSARNFTPPLEVVGAIDRMMPMLRMFRHPDSSLALFNGMGVTEPDALATVLAYDDARAQGNLNAPHSGYQRLEGDDLVLLMDVGAAPPPDFSRDAHAGALSFELSVNGHRLVVNCGAPGQNGALREAARLTAAHSTMTIGEQSSALVPYEMGGRDWMEGHIVIGPSPIRAQRHDDEDGCSVDAAHDGYAAPFGLIHTRRVTVFADGSRVEGVDQVSRSGRGKRPDVDYAIRFHLHPAVRAGRIESGLGVLLVTPGGEQWTFHAGGFPIDIEESAFFAVPDRARVTHQLVIRGSAAEHGQVNWVFMRG
ncbi:MAG: heparinase II/III family protein [Beijerinckiaceae bacterium]|nr:heparinase II/III family protein [Beijerinckiaceae bacterium]